MRCAPPARLESPRANPADAFTAALYDTTRPGYGNGGHTFGDALTDVERAAVLEYLKTR